MKYYERIIRRGYYDTVLYRKKLGRGEKKIWLFVLGPDTPLVIFRSANQKSDDSGERAQPGTSVWLLYTDDLHFYFALLNHLLRYWGQLLAVYLWQRTQRVPSTLYLPSSAPMIS